MDLEKLSKEIGKPKDLKEAGKRLQKYLRSRNLSVDTVAKELKLPPAKVQNMLEGKKYNVASLLTLLIQCPDLNHVWLLLGEGEMLKSDDPCLKKSSEK